MDKKFQVHPEKRASLLSKITLWWIVDLLRRGKRKTLEPEDLYPLKREEQSEPCSNRLEEIWENELKSVRREKRKPKLWKALLRYYTWMDYAFLILVALLNIFGVALSTFCTVKLAVIIAIDKNFSDTSSFHSNCLVYLYGAVFGYVLDTTASNHYNRYTPILAIRARAAILGLVYKKVLRQSKVSIDPGCVMELVCNDTTRCVIVSDYSFFYGIRRSLHGVFFVGWLFLLIGWAIIPNMIVVLLLLMFRIFTTTIDLDLRRKASEIAGVRMRYLREVLTIIHSVKQNCLEQIYEEKICNTRWEEIKKKAKRLVILSISFSSSICGPHLITCVTVIVVVLRDPTMLNFEILFSIAFVNTYIAESFCLAIPTAIHFSTDIITALVRIGHLLADDNLELDMIEEGSDFSKFKSKWNKNNLTISPPFLRLENVSCLVPHSVKLGAERKHTKELLKNVSLNVQYSGLVVVFGPVGSGKSLLLASILKGELCTTQGKVTYSGRFAYVSDTPWVFPGTLRENILFGLPYDEEWYFKIIVACQLEKDFEKFPQADLSRIGENSATISGGQRTRIALARAVYSKADIYLLDDPFSSLDVKVAENIFKECVKELLANRIVLLTTHAQRYWKEADHIVQMYEGKVVAQGTFEDFQDKLSDFELGMENLTKCAKDQRAEEKEAVNEVETGVQLQVVKENREIGNVSFNVYRKFFMYGAPAVQLLIMFLIVISGQGLTVVLHVQVSSLSNVVAKAGISSSSLTLYLIVFSITLVMIIIGQLCTLLLPLKASYKIHNKMVSCILQAPSSFFARNPVGRIFNRFSQDLNNLEELLPFDLAYIVLTATPCIGGLVLCFVEHVYLIPVAVIAFVAAFFLAKFFFGSAMDIKRLMQIGGEPIYSHFSNTMAGLTTIRVYNQQQKFTDVLFRHVDHHHEAMFVYYTSLRWFAITLDLLVLSFFVVVAFIEIYSERNSSTAVIAAVAIMYSYSIVRNVYPGIRFAVEANSQMTSAERTLTYTEIEPENGRNLEKRPPNDWPNKGSIRFNNVSLRHYNNGPCALKNVTFEVKSCEKIGIAGRTGAGKSSLVAAIMRMAETEGEIFIDDLNIEDLNVMCTRECISVISQSPILFDGSIRENVDPSGTKNDSEIWTALNQLDITSLVENLPEKLDTQITGTGSNFSVGQRQLLHIARILLKKNKVVIFDEATAKIDKKTDQQIQETVRRIFKDCTMFIISHRLSTILDCDKVIMLDQGKIVEFDQPQVLLQRENGLLNELLNVSNSR